MNKMRRLLALMLCMILTLSPLESVLAEGDFFDDEIVIAEMSAPELEPLPAEIPGEVATEEPTQAPTEIPVEPTEEPAQEPTAEPVVETSVAPSPEATEVPDVQASAEPTAEPTSESSVEPTMEPTAEPSVEPSLVPEVEASVEPTIEPSAEPSAEPTVEPTEEALIDYTRSAAENPFFEKGYAALTASCMAYASERAEAEAIYNLENGVYYVNARSAADECDRLEVSFAWEGEVLTAWVDAAYLRPMSEEEIQAFVSERIASQETCYLGGNPELPLDAPSFSLPMSSSILSLSGETPVMSVEPVILVLGVKESRKLVASYSDGQTYPLSFTSDNTAIASVSEDGTVIGKKRGSTKIHLSDELGNEATVDVVVKKAPTLVKITLKNKTLGVGEQAVLSTQLSDGAASQIQYEIDNPDILTVDAATGEITAAKEGQAKVTVKTYNNKRAACTITVAPAPTSITIENPLEVMGVDQEHKLAVSLSAGSVGAYHFESDKPEVVSVDAATGEMIALAEGTANIRAYTYNDKETFMALEVKPAPSCVSFAEEEVRIGVGEKLPVPEITLGVEGEDCAGSYSLKSSNKKFMSITADGEIKGNRAGTVNLTVTTHNGMKDTLKVRVYSAPKSVSITPKKDTLGVGEKLQLKYSLPKNTMGMVSYSSSAPEIAEVDAVTGEVIAKAEGQAVITVKTFNNRKASSTITVAPAPTDITIDNAVAVLGVEQQYKLAVSLSAGSAGAYYFESDKPEVVSVDAVTGEMVAHAEGTANIRAYTYNDKETFMAVEVKPAPSCVSFAEEEVRIGVGEKLPVPEITLGVEGEDCAGSYSLKSSNKKFMSITADGEIKGNRAGTVNLTVTTHNGMKDTLKVRVYSAPKSVSITPKKDTLGVGEKLQLKYSLPKNTMGMVSYSSSAPEIAEVDAVTGEVIAKAEGQAVITVKTFNNRKASSTITVVPAPTDITIDNAVAILGVEQQYKLAVSLSAGSAGAYYFESDKPEVVSVDAVTGEMVAHAEGTANIRAYTYNDKETFMTVEVKAAPSCVSFAEEEVRIGVGEKLPVPEITLGVEGEDCAGSYSLKSSNKKFMSITADGEIKGNRAGTVNLTVTTHNGMKDTLKVRVYSAPKSVSITPKKDTLGVGEKLQLKYSLPKNTMGMVSYSSSAPEIAEVDAVTGEVIAKAEGQAVITVKTFNNRKASSTITVVPAPTDITIDNAVAVLGVDQEHKLAVSLNAGSAGAYNFESDKPEVVSVDAVTGEMVAHAEGTANIRAYTYNDKETFMAVEVKPAPSCVSFAEEEVRIGVGEKLPVPEITLGVEGEDCAGSYSLKSSNKKFMSITADGEIKGNRAGTVNLTVTTHNGMKDTLKVRVYSAPKSVSITPKKDTLGVGEKLQLKHSLPKNTMGMVSYSSSAPEIAEVDAVTGEVIAKAEGQAVITVKTFNNRKASSTITVAAAPEKVSLDHSTLVLGVNEVFTLTASVPAGSSSKFRFVSSDASIVSVDASTGKLNGMAPGTATITVSTYNDHEAKCEVTIKEAPTAVALQETSLTLSVGDTYQLQQPVLSGENAGCGKYTYGSSGKKYASVSSDGLIKGVRAGSATITVKTYNGKKDTLKVTVKAAPKSISFEQSSMTMFMWDELKPNVIFDNKTTGSYYLTTSNAQVATISEDGRKILPVAGGKAEITATSYNGKTAKMSLTILGMPESISLQPASLILGAGDSRTLQAVMPEGQGSPLLFTSSDNSVATVDSQGKVTAVAPGSAEITVETFNDKTSSCIITVMAAPSRVQLTPRSAGRSIDEGSIQLQMNFGSTEEGGRYTFSSSDTSVATVSSDGLVKFVSTGTVQIRVETYNGRSAVCDLTIGEKPTQISFEKGTYKVAIGDSIVIPATFDKGCESYTLSTGNADIAVASGDRVYGHAVGSTTLTATSRGGLSASCTLEVVPAPTGVSMDQDAVEVKLGLNPTVQLTASAAPDGVGSVYYMSSDPDVAAVDYVTGLVEGKSAGECVITAYTYDGKHSAQCKVTVRLLLHGLKIGIDPGHQGQQNRSQEKVSPKGGGYKKKVSSGCTGRATRIPEYKTVLTIGLQLRDALEALGAEVYMTRETHDVNISNQQRAKMMNNLGVDLVLRLHTNSSSSSSHKGLGLYLRYSCAYPNSVVNGKQLLANERALAKAIFAEYPKMTGCVARKIRYTDEYTGNNWSTVPCILVEMGYSSNAAEDRLLNTPAYQEKIVKGLINGICKYKGIELPY